MFNIIETFRYYAELIMDGPRLEDDLVFAAANNELTTFHDLLQQGADIHYEDGFNNILLCAVAHAGCDSAVWIVKNAKKLNYDLNFQDSFPYCRSKRWVASMAAVNGIDVTDRLKWQEGRVLKNTALILATKKGWNYKDPYDGKDGARCNEVIQALCENGADVNLQDACGNTALHIAVMKRDLDAIDELLKSGARMDIQNNAGLTAIQILDAVEHKDIGPFLYQQTGGDVNRYIFDLEDQEDWCNKKDAVYNLLCTRKPSFVTKLGLN